MIFMLAGLAAAAFAPPASDLWPYWATRDPPDAQVVDHSALSGFLSRYVVPGGPGGMNLVDYGHVTPAERSMLEQYIDTLESTEITRLNRAEQLAVWINLYNAVTVRVILDHYPVNSIRDIKLSRGLFSRGPWQAKLLEIEGEELSLDDIEYRILRPVWQDPRIHYAVNCASIGCPSIQPVAFTAANAEELLDRAASEYVNHPRGVSISNGGLTLSSIYDWFSDDFGGQQGALEHIVSFTDPATASQLSNYAGRIRYDYYWSLNDVR